MDADELGTIGRYLASIAEPGMEPPPAMVRLAERVDSPAHSGEGQFLRFLATLVQARRALLIGTTALNIWWVAKALRARGSLVAVEPDAERASRLRSTTESLADLVHIEVRVGRPRAVLPILVDENTQPFDFVLIDGDGTLYQHVFDLSALLMRAGGVIVSNNLLADGAVVGRTSGHTEHDALARFNRFLGHRADYETVVIPKISREGRVDALGVSVAVFDDTPF